MLLHDSPILSSADPIRHSERSIERDGSKFVSFTRADEYSPQPVKWLIEDWLVDDTLAALVGPSGSGKSFLAIDWAVRVATGTPWLGRKVRQGAVFILAGEGRNGIRKRIAGIEEAFGIRVSGAPLFIADCLPSLTDEVSASAVLKEMTTEAEKAFYKTAFEPALVIIDTVARAMAGANENSSEDMGRLVRSMDLMRQQWGACVLSLHHTGHGTETQTRARGSSAYRAALDSEFVLKSDDDTVTIQATKSKDWSGPAPLRLKKSVVELSIQGTQQEGASTLVLQGPPDQDSTQWCREQLSALNQSGKSVRQIAQETGLSKSKVQRLLKPSDAGARCCTSS